MPDYRQDDVSVRAEDNVVQMRITWTGSRRDGSVYSVPVEYALSVAGGVVASCVVTLDPADLPQVAEAGVEHRMGNPVEADEAT